MDKVTVLGIDIAKQVFLVTGMNERGKVILRKKLYRLELSQFIAQFPQTIIGMEACAGAHHWGKEHPFRYQQARRWVSSKVTHTRCSCCHALQRY